MEKTYVININSTYVRDVQVVYAPVGVFKTDEDVESFMDDLNASEDDCVNINGVDYGWADYDSPSIFLGIETGTSPEDAISKWTEYPAFMLEAIEVRTK